MNQLTFYSIAQASAALDLPKFFLTAARRLGCTAFLHGRVKAVPLVEFLAANVKAVNADVRLCWPTWVTTEPPALNSRILLRVARRAEELRVEVKPERRFRGRDIAAAVRRELTAELATKLALLPAAAATAEIVKVRERILNAAA